jgi:sporulation protein YlmC with PRC-barrel domain
MHMRDDMRNDRLHATPRGTIAPLGELDDFEVADGDPDVRGWDVRTADGRTVGEVDDLIVDTALMKARYLVVHVDHDALGTAEDRRILVPVGAARLDENDDRVDVPFNAAILAAMPAFDPKRFDREYETALRSRYVAAGIGTGGEGKDFYSHEHFDDNRFSGRRRQGRERSAYLTRSEEELAVGKRPVRAGEDLRKERVNVERHGKSAAGRADEEHRKR